MSPTQALITVVGLGPGDPGLITVETSELLKKGRVFLLTRNHPVVTSMPESASWPSFDHLDDCDDASGEICTRIADSLVQEAVHGPIVYAVPGHPLFGNATVGRLLQVATEHGTAVRLAPTVSGLASIGAILGIGPVDSSLQIVDPLELVSVVDAQPYAGGKMPVSPLRPAIVSQVDSPAIAAAVRQALLTIYPGDHTLALMTVSGSTPHDLSKLSLSDLNCSSIVFPFRLYIPAVDPLEVNRVPEGLQQIIARLRAPGGCPWDREQTHQSLTRHMLEEAYEVIHAIESGSSTDLSEELGDVLLQVYLHAQIAEEAGDFTFEDVVQAVSSKLVRRHPHVFGDRIIESSGAVIKAWDQIKKDERAERDEPDTESPFESIPPSLPALARAQTIIRRARSHGIDVGVDQSLSGVENRDASSEVSARIAQQLIEIVSAADRSGIDAEQALRRWTSSFIQEYNRSRMRQNS